MPSIGKPLISRDNVEVMSLSPGSNELIEKKKPGGSISILWSHKFISLPIDKFGVCSQHREAEKCIRRLNIMGVANGWFI